MRLNLDKSQLPFSGKNLLNKGFDDAYQAWKSEPSQETNAQVLQAMGPAIDRAISANVGQSNPVLKGHARRLALDALHTYDPKRSNIKTHLTSQFQQLRRFSRAQTEPVAVPERHYYNSLHAQRTTQELTDELGREPTITELADRTGMSTHKIRQLRRGTSSMAEGSLPTDPETGEPSSPGVSALPDDRLTVELLMDDLVPIDQKILEWTLGLNGEPQLSNQEIARRVNRSPGLISQRKRVLQQQLNTLSGSGLFGDPS